jgi:hypothetical protein
MDHPANSSIATGQRFSRLVVIAREKGAVWLCVCDCGNRKKVKGYNLRAGMVKSCGCLNRDLTRERNKRSAKHGEARQSESGGKALTPEYKSWRSMIQRCCDPNSKSYRLYGMRGITVCDRWRHSYNNFLADMGRKPTLDHTLDRRDVNKNYCLENCRWATNKEQQRNRRNNALITINGETRTIAEWAEMHGIHYETLRSRINRGILGEALLSPIKS